MISREMYEYVGENGRIVSPVKIKSDYTSVVRLIAEDGKMLTNGKIDAAVIDVYADDVPNWYEVDGIEEPDASTELNEIDKSVEARLAALEKSVNETLAARLEAVETKADQAVASTLKATTKS